MTDQKHQLVITDKIHLDAEAQDNPPQVRVIVITSAGAVIEIGTFDTSDAEKLIRTSVMLGHQTGIYPALEWVAPAQAAPEATI